MPGMVVERQPKAATAAAAGAKAVETKNARRRRLEKEKKQKLKETPTPVAAPSEQEPEPAKLTRTARDDVETEEDVDADVDGGVLSITEDDPLYAAFKNVLERFGEVTDTATSKEPEKPEVFYDDDDDIPDEDDNDEDESKHKLSKKKRKQQSKLSIAELKALVRRPELVEWTDPDSSDPRLLVGIKSYRNVVPVPTHWALKREYLSSKRGVEKAPFALPKFIQDTGIAEMRDAVLEKQNEASLKQKGRERMQPKMGKLDIDYQKLYEAFFRFQTKPELTRYGEVYYEGKEYETNLRHLRPGELSDELRDALGMPPGFPPPWLINQQRFGPPPSYPALKIAGLNAPPPAGAQWGFHPGGYGKPPVDEQTGQPLYGGDIYGQVIYDEYKNLGEPVERTLWGELQPQEEEEEEEEEEADDDDDDDGAKDDEDAADVSGLQTGTRSMAGTASVAPSAYGGTESVSDFTLRKQRKGTETEETPFPTRSAGQVIPEQSSRATGFFGSERTYDLKAGPPPPPPPSHLPVLGDERAERKRKAGDLDVSIDPDTLQRDDVDIKGEARRRYDEQAHAAAAARYGGAAAGAGNDEEQGEIERMIAEEHRKRQKLESERRGRR